MAYNQQKQDKILIANLKEDHDGVQIAYTEQKQQKVQTASTGQAQSQIASSTQNEVKSSTIQEDDDKSQIESTKESHNKTQIEDHDRVQIAYTKQKQQTVQTASNGRAQSQIASSTQNEVKSSSIQEDDDKSQIESTKERPQIEDHGRVQIAYTEQKQQKVQTASNGQAESQIASSTQNEVKSSSIQEDDDKSQIESTKESHNKIEIEDHDRVQIAYTEQKQQKVQTASTGQAQSQIASSTQNEVKSSTIQEDDDKSQIESTKESHNKTQIEDHDRVQIAYTEQKQQKVQTASNEQAESQIASSTQNEVKSSSIQEDDDKSQIESTKENHNKIEIDCALYEKVNISCIEQVQLQTNSIEQHRETHITQAQIDSDKEYIIFNQLDQHRVINITPENVDKSTESIEHHQNKLHMYIAKENEDQIKFASNGQDQNQVQITCIKQQLSHGKKDLIQGNNEEQIDLIEQEDKVELCIDSSDLMINTPHISGEETHVEELNDQQSTNGAYCCENTRRLMIQLVQKDSIIKMLRKNKELLDVSDFFPVLPSNNRQISQSDPNEATEKQVPYIKRRGFATITGQYYEIKMAMLLFLRSVNINSFYLATNINDAGDFDDIVLHLSDTQNDNSKIYFVQLKHKESENISRYKLLTLSTSKSFSLLRYYMSYRDQIKKEYLSGSNNSIFGGDAKDCELVLYTNAEIDFNPQDSQVTDDILGTGRCGIRYSFTEEKDPDIFSLEANIAVYKSFLLDLEVQISQVSEEEAVSLIRENALKFEHKINSLQFLFRPRLRSLKSVANQEQLQSLIQEMKNLGDISTYREFLKKVKIYSSQANENQLDEIIREKLQKLFGISQSEIKRIYNRLFKKFQTWWKSDQAYFLTENTPFWIAVVNSVFSKINATKIKDIKNLKISFSTDKITGLQKCLSDKQLVNIWVEGEFTLLSMSKILQVLENEGKQRYLVVSCDTALTRATALLELFKSEWCHRLVVECESSTGSLQPLLTQLGCILKACPHKKMILVTRKTDLMVTSMVQELYRDSFGKYKDKTNVLDFNADTQKRVMALKVEFQGYDVSLHDLVSQHEELKEAITEEILMKLLTYEKVTIGNKLADPIDYYLLRTLERKDHISTNAFRSNNCTETFAVCGVTEEELAELVSPCEKVCLFSDNMPCDNCRFIAFSEEIDNSKFVDNLRNVVWVRKNNGDFALKHSKDIRTLQCFINKDTTSSFWAETVYDLPERAVVITANPGMGKSTLFTHLTKQTKSADPTMWVIHVNLNSMTKYLVHMKDKQISHEQAIEFLTDAAEINKQNNSELERLLFEYSWHTTGKIVTLFDGFDEICPHYTNEVSQILKMLLLTRIKHLWISSRPLYKTKLEEITLSVPFELALFSVDNQKTFLEKLWKKQIPNVDSTYLNTFISELLNLVTRSLHDSQRRFTGIPLQTMFLAEVFEGHLREGQSTGSFKLPEQLNVLQLYEWFFQKKCDIYFTDKKGDDPTKPSIRIDNETIKKDIEENHKLLAIYLFLTLEDLATLHDKTIENKAKKFIRDINNGFDKIGIVSSMGDSKPQFIHRTFTEYFVAKWFSENIQNNRSFVMEKLTSPDYAVVAGMFNRMLSSNFKLHLAVINADAEEVKRLLTTENVNSCDGGGRTPLHLCALFGSCDTNSKVYRKCITKLLLDHDADVELTDDIFKWSPLRCADVKKEWGLIELILQNKGNVNDLVVTKHNIDVSSYIATALFISAQYGYTHLLQFLIQEGVEIDLSLDEDRNTALHIACQYGQLAIVKLLLKSGANVHACCIKGRTPLHLSMIAENKAVVENMLMAGANINCSDFVGMTPVHVAAEVGNLEIIQFVVQREVEEIDLDEDKSSERLFKVLEGETDKIMLQKPMLKFHDNMGRTPLDIAVEYNKINVVSYLQNTTQAIDTKLTDRGISNPSLFYTVCFLIEEKKAGIWKWDTVGRAPMHLACKNGLIDVIKYLVNERGASTDVHDRYNRTSLHYATKWGHLDVVKYLIKEREGKQNVVDMFGLIPLHYAVQYGHLKIVKYLVGETEYVRNEDTLIFKLINYAITWGQLEIMKYLVDKAKINRRFCETVLIHHAASHGQMGVLQYLVEEQGCNTNRVDSNGCFALHHAALFGNLQVIRYLVEDQGNVVNVTDNDGKTPLHNAVQFAHLEVVKYLVDKRTDLIEMMDKEKKTPLFYAVQYGQLEEMKYLVEEKGAMTEVVDTNDNGLLWCAAQHGHLNMIKYLVKRQGDVIDQDEIIYTLVYHAAKSSRLHMVEYLMDKHEDKSNIRQATVTMLLNSSAKWGNLELIKYLVDRQEVTTLQKKILLQYAALYNQLEVVKYILDGIRDRDVKSDCRKTVMQYAVKWGQMSVLKYLIHERKGKNEIRNHSASLLQYAAQYGQLEVMIYLIDVTGKNIQTWEMNYRRTLLHYVAWYNQLHIVQYLVEERLCISDQTDCNNNTVLHYACQSGKLDVIKYLIERGEKIDVVNNDRNSLLHYAARFGSVEMVKYLVDKSAIDVNARDKDDWTPLL